MIAQQKALKNHANYSTPHSQEVKRSFQNESSQERVFIGKNPKFLFGNKRQNKIKLTHPSLLALAFVLGQIRGEVACSVLSTGTFLSAHALDWSVTLIALEA